MAAIAPVFAHSANPAMARITTPPLQWLASVTGGFARRRKWQLTAKLIYGIESKDGPNFLIVPEGTVTDLASIPWPASLFVSPDSVPPAGPIIHDWVYRRAGHIDLVTPPPFTGEVPPEAAEGAVAEHLTRADADLLFSHVLINSGVARWKALLFWAAVRIGGAPGWGR